jgi:hypothetical protein
MLTFGARVFPHGARQTAAREEGPVYRYMRHELIALGQDLIRHAYEPRLEQEDGAMAVIEQTEGRLFRLAEPGNTGGALQTLSEVPYNAVESAKLEFNHDGGVTAVTTELRGLDRRPGGLQPSDLMTLADRAWSTPRLPPARALTASPTHIGGNAIRRHAQTQGGGLFPA